MGGFRNSQMMTNRSLLRAMDGFPYLRKLMKNQKHSKRAVGFHKLVNMMKSSRIRGMKMKLMYKLRLKKTNHPTTLHNPISTLLLTIQRKPEILEEAKWRISI